MMLVAKNSKCLRLFKCVQNEGVRPVSQWGQHLMYAFLQGLSAPTVLMFNQNIISNGLHMTQELYALYLPRSRVDCSPQHVH